MLYINGWSRIASTPSRRTLPPSSYEASPTASNPPTAARTGVVATFVVFLTKLIPSMYHGSSLLPAVAMSLNKPGKPVKSIADFAILPRLSNQLIECPQLGYEHSDTSYALRLMPVAFLQSLHKMASMLQVEQYLDCSVHEAWQVLPLLLHLR